METFEEPAVYIPTAGSCDDCHALLVRVEAIGARKQDKLTPGANIQIVGNVISIIS